jgi:hypothetical protein
LGLVVGQDDRDTGVGYAALVVAQDFEVPPVQEEMLDFLTDVPEIQSELGT